MQVHSYFPEAFLHPLQQVILSYVVPQLRHSALELGHMMALSGVYSGVIASLAHTKASELGLFGPPNDITDLTLRCTRKEDTGPHDYLWPEIVQISPQSLIGMVDIERLLHYRRDPTCWDAHNSRFRDRIITIPMPTDMHLSNMGDVKYVAALLETQFVRYRQSLLLGSEPSVVVMIRDLTSSREILKKRFETGPGFQLRDFREGTTCECKQTVTTEPGLSITMLDLVDSIAASRHWWVGDTMTLDGIDPQTGAPILLVSRPSMSSAA